MQPVDLGCIGRASHSGFVTSAYISLIALIHISFEFIHRQPRIRGWSLFRIIPVSFHVSLLFHKQSTTNGPIDDNNLKSFCPFLQPQGLCILEANDTFSCLGFNLFSGCTTLLQYVHFTLMFVSNSFPTPQ